MGFNCDETCDNVSNYDSKFRIHNTDRSTESSMNKLAGFIFAKVDMSEHGHKHPRYLHLVRLYDAEQHLDKAYIRQEERKIVRLTIFIEG